CNRWPVGLDPIDAEHGGAIRSLDLPGEMDPTIAARQCAVLCSIAGELMKRHCEREGDPWRHELGFAAEDHPAVLLRMVRREHALEDRSEVAAFPRGRREVFVRPAQRDETSGEGVERGR